MIVMSLFKIAILYLFLLFFFTHLQINIFQFLYRHIPFYYIVIVFYFCNIKLAYSEFYFV